MKTELILMYTWDIKGYYDNKICGHIYELIDYYYILKDHFDIKIIFPNNYNLDLILKKYDFTQDEIEQLREKIISRPKSGIIKTTGGKGLVLVTDGNLGNFKGFIYGIPIQFSCGKTGLIPQDAAKWYLLHDERIGDSSIFENFEKNPPKQKFNYNKKVLLKLKQIHNYKSKNVLFYLTSNCKYRSEEHINKIIESKQLADIDIYIIIDYNFDKTKLNYNQERIKIIDISKQAIDIFSLDFGTYIYTEVKRQWDCSNRLIIECKYHNKNVEYFIDYIDQALEVRKNDLDLPNLSYELKPSDSIKDILIEISELEKINVSKK